MNLKGFKEKPSKRVESWSFGPDCEIGIFSHAFFKRVGRELLTREEIINTLERVELFFKEGSEFQTDKIPLIFILSLKEGIWIM